MPERWLPGDPAAAKQAKVCFMGFGEGARACPGSRFALTEAKVALLRIYSAFTLQLAPYQVPAPDTRSLVQAPPCSATVCCRSSDAELNVSWVAMQEPLPLRASITMSAKNGVLVRPMARC